MVPYLTKKNSAEQPCRLKRQKIGSSILRLDNSPDTFRALILNQSTEKDCHQSIINELRNGFKLRFPKCNIGFERVLLQVIVSQK
jgi:hypothetical protein